jgi:hypothetical protein
MSSPAGKIQAIHRYPVKGLTPEPLPQATLAVRQTIPCRPDVCDRERTVRIRRGRARLSPKQRFLMLMRHARLASCGRRSTSRATR